MARTPRSTQTVPPKTKPIRRVDDGFDRAYNYEPPLPRQSARPQHYPVRRILGEKKENGKIQYLVEWFPSYVPAAFIKDAKNELKDWNTFKRSEDSSDFIFNYGGKTFLKDDVETTNYSEEMQRLMFENVMDMFKKELGIVVNKKKEINRVSRVKELFSQTEWRFANGHEEKALKIAVSRGDKKITAATLLSNSYLQALAQFQDGADIGHMDLPYGKIKIKYLNQLDGDVKRGHNGTKRMNISIVSILEPVFYRTFETMSPESFRGTERPESARLLNHYLRQLCKYAPFLLQRPWILFLVRIAIPSDDLVPLIKGPPAHIKVNKNWPDRSRDIMMQVYRDEKHTMDFRTPHDIQETYLNLRDLFSRMLEPERKEEKKGEEEQSEESEDESEAQEDDDGYDEQIAFEDVMDVDVVENSE